MQTKFRARQYFHRCLSVHGGGSASRGSASRGGLPLEGCCLQRGVCIHGAGVCLRGGLDRPAHPRKQKSGRYASYWNAFLFSKISSLLLSFQLQYRTNHCRNYVACSRIALHTIYCKESEKASREHFLVTNGNIRL